MLTLCILLSIIGRKNKNNIVRANMLLKSLAKFSQEDLPVYLISPRDAINYIKSKLNTYNNLQYTFISDEDIMPEICNYRHINSWYIQQVLKLLVNKFLDTEFYMLFDADVLCCRDFSSSSFINNHRSYVSYTRAKNCFDWTRGSAMLLRLKETEPEDLIMGVTPNIFAREIAGAVLAQLEQTYRRRPELFLLEHTETHWSEYTLYYLYARASGLFPKKHIDFLDPEESYPANYLLSDYSLWRKSSRKDLECLDLTRIREEPGYFLVVQSTSPLSMEAIGRKFAPFLS